MKVRSNEVWSHYPHGDPSKPKTERELYEHQARERKEREALLMTFVNHRMSDAAEAQRD